MCNVITDTDELYEVRSVLLDVEGSLLAYWTDMPEPEVIRLQTKIRETLKDFEPKTN